jgi:uncharacterized protein (DUF433 family)
LVEEGPLIVIMGGKIVVPEADANIQKVVKNFNLTPKDISDFWKIFQL